jgi:protein phosphatase PTC7
MISEEASLISSTKESSTSTFALSAHMKSLIPHPSTTGDYLKTTFGSHSNVQVEMIPHPLKVAKGGEDAFFIGVHDGNLALGVADGVGGWGHQGIDPSLVSKGLMLGAKHAFEKLGQHDPVEIMEYGRKQVQHITGSSTALVIVLSNAATKLTAANLGDSGFMVIRENEVFYRSEEMQHFFNFPYQLGTGHTTTAYDSQVIELDLQDGDIIIAGTDALFDNLFDEEILEIVKNATPNENVANTLAIAVFNRGYTNHPSPFMKVAHRLGLIDTERGGKPDDITVLVTKVTTTQASQ